MEDQYVLLIGTSFDDPEWPWMVKVCHYRDI